MKYKKIIVTIVAILILLIGGILIKNIKKANENKEIGEAGSWNDMEFHIRKL